MITVKYDDILNISKYNLLKPKFALVGVGGGGWRGHFNIQALTEILIAIELRVLMRNIMIFSLQ